VPAVIVGAKLISRGIPGVLIAVAGAIAVSWALDLQAHGVHVLGAIPGGLPSPRLPLVNLSGQLFQQLIPPGFAIFVVILAQSATTSGVFAVNGSPTTTQAVNSAGGNRQLAQIITAIMCDWP